MQRMPLSGLSPPSRWNVNSANRVNNLKDVGASVCGPNQGRLWARSRAAIPCLISGRKDRCCIVYP